MKNPSSISTLVLAVLLALALGYIAGTGRGESRAVAGPIETSVPGVYMTTDPGGLSLVVWSVREGQVTAARTYELQADRRIEPPAKLIIENPRINATVYTSFAAPPTTPTPIPTPPTMDGK